MTLALSECITRWQLEKFEVTITLRASSTAIISAQPMSLPLNFQLGIHSQASHWLLRMKPIPQEVDVLMKILIFKGAYDIDTAERRGEDNMSPGNVFDY
jgi:hypothetical protein